MNSKEHLLILTDHSQHSDNNSFYALASAFYDHPHWERVDVCSRGLSENRDFFRSLHTQLWINSIKAGDDFEKMRGEWMNQLQHSDLNNYDAILLRLPRPVSEEFFIFLEEKFPKGKIVNRPSGIFSTGNKKFLLNFPEITPPTRWVKNEQEAINFSKYHDIVLKPAEEYGGKGLLRLSQDKLWVGDKVKNPKELQEHFLPEGMLAMKFMESVDKGDKRTIVADDKIIGCTIRYPAKDSWLCNIAQGGYAEVSEPDEDDFRILESIGPVLKKEGVILYGFDTLVDQNGRRVLSEINSLSIGGIGPLEKATGQPLSRQIAEIVTNELKN